MNKIASLDHEVQEVYEWLNEINRITGWDSNSKAYAALHATLRLLRDNLTLDDCVKLAAQLSPLIRGFYYENWRPCKQPLRERSAEEFIDNLIELLREYNHSDIDPELAASSVFKTLANKTSAEEVNKIFSQLPKGVRKYF